MPSTRLRDAPLGTPVVVYRGASRRRGRSPRDAGGRRESSGERCRMTTRWIGFDDGAAQRFADDRDRDRHPQPSDEPPAVRTAQPRPALGGPHVDLRQPSGRGQHRVRRPTVAPEHVETHTGGIDVDPALTRTPRRLYSVVGPAGGPSGAGRGSAGEARSRAGRDAPGRNRTFNLRINSCPEAAQNPPACRQIVSEGLVASGTFLSLWYPGRYPRRFNVRLRADAGALKLPALRAQA